MKLTRQQALENLCRFYHSDLERLEKEQFLPSEEVVFAANCGGDKLLGYCVVTTERVFHVTFEPQSGGWSDYRSGLTKLVYSGEKPGWFSTYDFRNYTFAPPDSELTGKELASRTIREMRLSRVVDVGRRDHQAALGSREVGLIELWLQVHGGIGGLGGMFLNEDDGQALYGRLQATIEERTKAGADSSGLVSLMQCLSRLHAAGILSDGEFAAKSQELLARKS